MSLFHSSYDVVIIGAGAAGLMCAMEAGKRGRRVLVIDHARRIGEKIRISGGGRCNFTNIHASPAQYLSENPRFCVSALSRYTPSDFIALVEKHHIAYHEKTLGQLFCDHSATQIIQMLLDECAAARVEITKETSVRDIKKKDGVFHMTTLKGEGQQHISAESVVIACGGPSIPKIGATDKAQAFARSFGLRCIPLRPALVPFLLAPDILQHVKAMAGVSLDVSVTCGTQTFAEGMLFTHRGLSGPSMLQISSYWREGEAITVNFLPGVDIPALVADARKENGKQDIAVWMQRTLPKRLAHYIIAAAHLSGRIGDLKKHEAAALIESLGALTFLPSGTEGYRTAEVTLGGIDTDELSSKTMEARRVSGLYAIGEAVDVTGHLGGYNFQWAWASGYAAGQAV